MAKTTTNPFTQDIKTIKQTLVNADSFHATNPGTAPTNSKLLFTADATDGSIVKAITMATDATVAAQLVAFWISPDGGTTKYMLGVVNVPLNSGHTGAIINVDVLNNQFLSGLTMDQTGRQVLPMEAGTSLYVSCLTQAVAASKTIWITGVAEDF